MHKVVSSIKLVSLRTNQQQASLFCLLSRMYDDVSIVNKESWIQRQITDPNCIIVLVLPTPDISVDNVLNAISATPKSYYLGIFARKITQEIESILNVCDDCCSSECDESELAFRLKRMLLAHNEFADISDTHHQNKVWADLNLIGKSKVFQEVLSMTKRAANCDAAVLIEGDTGCGKEMVARAVHYLSSRKDYPFIPINCGAVPDHLIENELFGHEKGAFTDAKQSHAGSIEQADGGTLFLDEIEALSAKGQVTLLRFIEDKKIKPLGALKSKQVNVRIIAASNASLTDLVEQGLFRKDLLFRLNLLYLCLPPLAKRKNDIHDLSEFFMQKYRRMYKQPKKQLHPETKTWMEAYHWPGNVRELENFIHRSFLLSEDVYVLPKDQNDTDPQSNSRRTLLDRRLNFEFDASFSDAKENVIKHFEKQYLSWLISKSSGNVTLAANNAQKERRALGKLLKKHDIDPTLYRKN